VGVADEAFAFLFCYYANTSCCYACITAICVTTHCKGSTLLACAGVIPVLSGITKGPCHGDIG